MKIYFHRKRKVWIPWTIALVCGLLLLSVMILYQGRDKNAEAAGASTYAFAPDADFRILEIVPCHSLGEVGYLVKGEEPIDLDGVNLCKNYPNDGDLMSILQGIVEWQPYYHHKTRLDEGEHASDYFISTSELEGFLEPEEGTNKILGNGYYERVEDGEGLYGLSGKYRVVTNKTGIYNPAVDYFSYSDSQNGDYELNFSTQSETDWNGVNIQTDWGQYKVRSIDAVSDQSGDYSAVCKYQTSTPNYNDKCVMFTYDPKTEGTDFRVRYRAEVMTDTSRFGDRPSPYYKLVAEHYVYDPGNGTHYVRFVQDDSGDYVGTVIGGAEYYGSRVQLLYQLSYRYTENSGDYNITFDHKNSGDSGDTYYVRSDYEIHPGTGTYALTCKKINGQDHYVEDSNGDYLPQLIAKSDASNRTGADYVWVECEPEDFTANTKSFGEVGYQMYCEEESRDLIYFYRGSYVNLEVFKKHVMRLEDTDIDNCKVDVLSLTPEEVNQNVSLIEQADFIYIIPTVHNTAYVRWYERFGDVDGEILYASNTSKIPNFYYRYTNQSYTKRESNDLTWEATYQIFYQVAVKNKALFIDCTVYSSYTDYWADDIPKPYGGGSTAGTSNNVAKLYIMLMQRKPIDFYNLFFAEDSTETYKIRLDGETITDRKTGFSVNTGYFNSPNGNAETAVYWNQNTFLPEVPNGTSNVEAYYQNEGIDNPWVSVEKAIVSVHNTNASFKSDISLNGVLEEERWTDKELLKYIMERDQLDTMPTIATGYDMLNYIIRFGLVRSVIYKGTLKVLDVEPCEDQTLTAKEVSNWCNNQVDTENITIVPMTMSEFIGSTEVLAEHYDFVYLGASTAKMNLNVGNTVYNETSLDGFIYLHTGDLIKEIPKVGGLLNRDRYETITSEGLQKYLKDSSFFEVQSDIFDIELGNARYSGNDITKLKLQQLQEYVNQGFPVIVADRFYHRSGTEYSIDKDYVDNSSYLYQFLNQSLIDNQVNVIRRNAVSAKLMSALLMKPRIQIETSGTPDAHTWPDEYQYKIDAGESPVYLSAIGTEYRLRYRFKLQSMDRFPDLLAQTYHVELRVDYDGDGQFEDSEKQVIAVTQEDTVVLPDESGRYALSLNTNYIVDCAVKTDDTGLLPYKIMIQQNGVNDVRCSYVGYTAIKAEKTKEVKALQIISDDYDGGTGQAEEYLHLNLLSKDSSSLLYKYLENLDEYHFEFTTMKVSEFIQAYRNEPEYDGTLATSRFSSYDMVILGGGEHFNDIDTEKGIQDLRAYIRNGGSVLFLSDTTSPINVPKESYRTISSTGVVSEITGDYWGYQINHNLRNLLGMDRYGVTIDYDSSLNEAEKTALKAAKDQAYEANSNQNRTAAEVQGFTYYSLNQYAYSSIIPQKKNLAATTSVSASLPATKATQVNLGSISQYPYQISSTISIADTHAQYYQLDFEQDQDGDGNSDLTVWYCLSDDGAGDGVYSCSPNDVRNNYYLYTLGNVTYSGVGLNEITDSEEAKLFVNTLVAAYRVTETNAQLHVNEATEIRPNEFCSYIDTQVDQTYDASSGIDHNIEKYYKKVTFQITDDELTQISVVITDASGKGYRIYDAADNEVVGKCATNTEYNFYVPKEVLNHVNSYEFTIHYGTQYGKLTLMRRNLFNLQ